MNHFHRFLSVLNSIGSVWIFALTFIICADVVARNLFAFPLRGVSEFVGYSIVGAVFLQLAHALHVGSFVRAGLLIGPLEERRSAAASLAGVLFHSLGFLVFVLIASGGYAKFTEAWPDLVFGVEGEFTILVWPLRLIVCFGAALAAFEYLFLIFNSVSGLRQSLRDRSVLTDLRAPRALGLFATILGSLILFAVLAVLHPSNALVGVLSLVSIVLLISAGLQISIALIVCGFVGIWIMKGDTHVAFNVVMLTGNDYLRSYFFGVVPLFVLMGLLVNESDIGKDTFDVASWSLRGVKGGLAVATVFANAIFAAITGSSIASAAVFSKVATPHMLKQGYSMSFAVGTVAGSSVLGMLIPPSLLLIVYGFVSEQSVGALFKAAILPGLLLAGAMAAMIIVRAHYSPGLVGGSQARLNVGRESLRSSLRKLTPILVLIGMVLGGIYGGLITPVEAGAVGAAGALILSLLKRRLSGAKLWSVLIETGHSTVAILFLILAAGVYGRMLALSGLPQFLGAAVGAADLGFYTIMALYIVVLVLLGMFLDSISIILIVSPILLPIIESFGADLVWFGIVTVLAVEMGLLTPPFGLSVFIVKATLEDKNVSLQQIFAGALPFVLVMLLVVVLLIAFPGISLILIR